MLCQDCLPTVECMTCQYYCPHYIKRGGRYVPLAYGHCTRPAERGAAPESLPLPPLAPEFGPENAV